MSPLDDLWLRIRHSPAFATLPEVVRDSPGFFLAVLVLGIVALVLFRRRSRARQVDRSGSRQLKQEIRDCRREGDLLGLGQRYEALGRMGKALAAYRQGGHGAEHVELLLRLGRRREAKEIARQVGEWSAFATLCEEEGELAEAGAAHERAGHLFAAARCFEGAGESLLAADCYQRSGLASKAIEVLAGAEGREAAVALEKAVRAALAEGSGEPEPDVVAAIGRCAQLWLEVEEAERAFQLATDSEQWNIAAPIARDFLAPSPQTAELCARAGDFLSAAEIYKALGKLREEALARAEFFDRQESPAEAAHWYEIGEEWSLAGDRWVEAGQLEKAAELLIRAGEFRQASELYGQIGNVSAQAENRRRAEAMELGEDFGEKPGEKKSAGLDSKPLELIGEIPPTQRYQLRDEIGRGGMGVVFRAEDLVLRRLVAVKSVAREKLADAKTGDAMLAEARAVAQLSHPNIVQVYDAGRTEDGFFIVMELVEGNTFSDLLERGKLGVPGVVKVGRQICSALDHAHRRRIVHRDLKPSNLLWAEGRRVKLTDFGLARAFDESLGQVLTRPAGTPFYMAPEQIRGEPVDPRTDIYSLGCVLFELLCNRSPFDGQGNSIFHHLNTEPSDPRDFRLDIPETLADLVLRCLHKIPRERPASAAAVGKDLAVIESGLG